MNRARKMDERLCFAPAAAAAPTDAIHQAVEQTLEQLEDTLRQKREIRSNVTRLLHRLSKPPATE